MVFVLSFQYNPDEWVVVGVYNTKHTANFEAKRIVDSAPVGRYSLTNDVLIEEFMLEG